MPKWTRRNFLKTGVAASAGATSLLPSGTRLLSGETSSASAPDGARPASAPAPRERTLLDFGWRFHLGHADDPAQDFDFGRGRAFQKTGDFFKPSHPDFDASGWRAVDLPHDWAVELPFHEDPWLIGHGSKPLGRTYPATSIGWYRRVFQIPAGDLGKRLSLEFDGVFRDSMVALNGNFLGRNMSGYAPFCYDITDHANYGGNNVLVVRVDATEFEGWWYEGAGIYRHVWLVKTHPLHVPQWGTFVASEVQADGPATLSISTEVGNDQDSAAECRVVSAILDGDGKPVVTARSATLSVPGWRRREVRQKVRVSDPRLWSLETRHLYTLVTIIETGGVTVDRYETPFGIRTIRFDPDKGFFLNGKSVKVKGTCNHQDHAGVGIALPDRLQYYRIAKLKEMGSNGLRTSHNAPTPELLDACDRLGMLVLDETRMFLSAPESLSQLSRMVRRDRNHPSVMMWSTGNEEPEEGSERGARICTTMKRLIKRLDPTRPITQAMSGGWGKGIPAVVDVQGFNYHANQHYNYMIDDFHREFPSKPSIGTEDGSTLSTRGIYYNDKEKGYVWSYDLSLHDGWPTPAEGWWPTFDDRAFLSGAFVWTGFDYRGEPTPYGWPCISSHFGIMDTCGFPKDNFYYFKSWWGQEPVLHLFPHWNWPGKEGEEISVWCYSNLEKIELFLNGKSLGAQAMKRDSHVEWKVKYTSGILEARGYRNGRLVLTDRRETTGVPAKILFQPDRQRIAADGQDVSVLAVSVVDAKGQVVPVADNEIEFELSGNGKVIGVGNGNPSSHEPDKASRRKAFNGLCVAIVQSTRQAGEIKVQATSLGLESATVTIQCEQAALRPSVA
ncbi:MAG TPA: beta-galactosidase GalA [Terriglobia bacterium]|nr:beta-galactosidase GalA [Terriglobia bacterium]